jgi:hypothetical protein
MYLRLRIHSRRAGATGRGEVRAGSSGAAAAIIAWAGGKLAAPRNPDDPMLDTPAIRSYSLILHREDAQGANIKTDINNLRVLRFFAVNS